MNKLARTGLNVFVAVGTLCGALHVRIPLHHISELRAGCADPMLMFLFCMSTMFTKCKGPEPLTFAQNVAATLSSKMQIIPAVTHKAGRASYVLGATVSAPDVCDLCRVTGHVPVIAAFPVLTAAMSACQLDETIRKVRVSGNRIGMNRMANHRLRKASQLATLTSVGLTEKVRDIIEQGPPEELVARSDDTYPQARPAINSQKMLIATETSKQIRSSTPALSPRLASH